MCETDQSLISVSGLVRLCYRSLCVVAERVSVNVSKLLHVWCDLFTTVGSAQRHKAMCPVQSQSVVVCHVDSNCW